MIREIVKPLQSNIHQLPCRWSFMYFYHFYQYLRHLNLLAYCIIESSVCLPHIYILQLELHNIHALQEENLHLYLEHQAIQD